MLVKDDVHTLTADITFRSQIVFIAFDLRDAVSFHKDFQTAILCAKDTTRFMPLSHIYPLLPQTFQLCITFRKASSLPFS